ncbi:amidohydrolase family protein [Phyllobacterium sp. 21LDTY02-6]|uniref:amidohydrolase family protein n=1 Tax=Phyllobacterium sp. 21LDTY02-6 TaxID=2944903 RepID=UPI002020B2A8|nr:amidohydrolase family protein [Phyllobacterium sp. 21LDTY02-6]MCO4317887.1 amidohydrolase family protein [Phyllobacterium sp. 21LDTY02-6]
MDSTIDLIVMAGLIVTMDQGRSLITDGAVAVNDGKILAVGPRDAISQRYAALKTVGGNHAIVMPGFIDGHSHAGHGLIRTMGSDDFPAFREACRKVYMESASLDFWAAEARLSALERLKAGVTTATLYLGGGDENNRSDTPEVATTYAAAFCGVGMKLVLGIGPTRPPFPRHYTHFRGDRAQTVEVNFDRQLSVCEEVARILPGARTRVAFTAPVINPAIHRDRHFRMLCEMAQTMKDLARKYDTLLMIDGHREGTVAFANGLDILDHRTLLSHAIGLKEDEVALIAELGAVVSNNAVSASGTWDRCPLVELLAAGARVFLSSDGLAPDGGTDMFDVMRGAMRYHRSMCRNPNILPPGRALSLTTIETARALGIDHEVGSIEPGKRADIILVDTQKPHLQPSVMPLHQLLMYANASDIDTVIVDGQVMMENRQVAQQAEILSASQVECQIMLDRSGLRTSLDLPKSFWSDSYDRPVRDGLNHHDR